MEKEIKNIDYIELIVKYFAKETTAKEISMLENWVLESPDNKRIFNNYKQVWLLTKQQKQFIKVDDEWNNISSKLFTVEKSIKPKNNIFLKIAVAVVVLLVSSYSVMYLTSNKSDTLIADNSFLESTLKDGTVITLNQNSQLEIDNKFNKNKRHVKLTGDAFFKVHRNENKPFIIECNNIKVEVLGTSFYVKSDGENNEVIVKSGKVSVKQANSNNELILTANEKCVYINGKLIKVSNSDNILQNTGLINFKNEKLSTVINQLNKAYHSNITIGSNSINDSRITAKFDNQSLDAVLNILKATLDIDVNKRDTEIIITDKNCKK